MVTSKRWSILSVVLATRCAWLRVLFLLALVTCHLSPVSASAADFVPVFAWQVDADDPESQEVPIRRSSTLDIQPTFQVKLSALTLSNVTSVVMLYKAEGSTNVYPATGSVFSASAGTVNVRLHNGLWLTNSAYSADIYLMDTTNTVAACPITIALTDDTGYQAVTSTPTAIHSLDWLTLINFNPGSAPFPYFIGSPAIGQSLSWNGTNWIPSSAGAGDMLTTIFFPTGIPGPLALASDVAVLQTGKVSVVSIGSAAYSNASAFATAAEGTAGTNAQAIAQVLQTNTVTPAQLVSGTNDAVGLANDYADGLAGNYATAAQGISGTNAQARVGILETNSVTPAQLASGTNGAVESAKSYADAHQWPASSITNGSDQFTVSIDPNTIGTNGLLNLGYLPRAITYSSVYGIVATAGCTSQWQVLYGPTNSFTPTGTNGLFTFTSAGDYSATWSNAVCGAYSNRYLRLLNYNPANSNSVAQVNYGW